MTTAAQIQANRTNARKSTGPRTPEGKEKASQNALKHGLRARQAVIPGEDPAEFEEHREEMLAELAPAGAVQTMLAERIVHLSWRLRRAERVQNAVFDTLYAREVDYRPSPRSGPLAPGSAPANPDGDWVLGRTIIADFANRPVLDRLLTYERRIESSLYKAMRELERLKRLHHLNPPTTNPTPQSQTRSEPQTANQIERYHSGSHMDSPTTAPDNSVISTKSLALNEAERGEARTDKSGAGRDALAVRNQISPLRPACSRPPVGMTGTGAEPRNLPADAGGTRGRATNAGATVVS